MGGPNHSHAGWLVRGKEDDAKGGGWLSFSFSLCHPHSFHSHPESGGEEGARGSRAGGAPQEEEGLVNMPKSPLDRHFGLAQQVLVPAATGMVASCNLWIPRSHYPELERFGSFDYSAENGGLTRAPRDYGEMKSLQRTLSKRSRNDSQPLHPSAKPL